MDTMEIDDLLKGHQVGDIHPNHPNWVWTQTKSGKYDWRIAKKGTGGGGSSSEGGGEEDSGAGGKKPATSAPTSPKFQAMLDNPGKHADALAAHAQNASTSDLTDVVNNKKLNSQVRQIAFDALKERKDYDADKTDSSDLKGGKTSGGGGQNAKLISNLNIFHDNATGKGGGFTREEIDHNRRTYIDEMEDALAGKKFTMKNVGAEPTLHYPDFKLEGIYNMRNGKNGNSVVKFSESGKATQEWTHQDLCDLLSGKEVKMPDGDVYQLKTDDTGDEGTTDTKEDKKSDTQAKPARNAKAVSKLDSLCADAMNRSASTLDRQKSLSRYGKALANTMLGKTIKVETTYGRKYDVTLRRMYKCKFGYGGIKTGFEDNKGETWDDWSHEDICNLLSGKEVKASDGYTYKLKADTMESKDDILKAHQVGDQHPSKPWVWTEYKPGKFDWRPNKNGAGRGGSSKKEADEKGQGGKKSGDTETKKPQTTKKFEDMLADPTKHADELADYAKEASTQVLSDVVNNKTLHQDVRQIAFNALKKRSDYDATKVDSSDLKGGHAQRPKATVKYKQAPKVEIELPDEFNVKGKGGGLVHVDTATRINQYRNLPEDKLLNILNGEKVAAISRQIAYEVAAEKGVDESKINVKGTLQKMWDEKEKAAKAFQDDDDDFSEEEEEYDMAHISVEEIEDFMKQFSERDKGWDNQTDSRVKAKFNNLKTPADRQKYDAFRDYQKRLSPKYRAPKKVIKGLNKRYWNFIDREGAKPLFISAGGAGVGKTYGFKKAAELRGVKPFEPGVDKPEDQDWGYVDLASPKSDTEFRKFLKQYGQGNYLDNTTGEVHGKILVFDDADSILTHAEYQETMKKILDSDPSKRVFKDPDTGQMVPFTGRIVIMTNKSMDVLYANQDKTAIMSRAKVSDIKFTVNENLEVLADRYKTMHIEGLTLSSADEAKAREAAYQFILDRKDDLDPAKFTVRKFIDIVDEVQDAINAENARGQSQALSEFLDDSDWEEAAEEILDKAQQTDTEENVGDIDDSLEPEEQLDAAQKKRLAAAKRKNPKLYAELFNDEDEPDEDDDKGKAGKKRKKGKVEKSLFNDMSLDEAENLLFS